MGLYRKYVWGRHIFFQSVWYNNEDYVLLGNKPYDMMGLDSLSDNIITAEFTDDDEKFFDVNECIDLNEDNEPDMGLKFQSRQA